MDWFADPQAWIALGTLTVLEIVLGIDNIVFISILSSKLPPAERDRAKFIGLALAMTSRIGLLFSLSWLMQLTAPIITIADLSISGRDAILIAGGLFLLAKSTYEIHDKLEGVAGTTKTRAAASFTSVLIQIMALDIVFSLDSVITAIGMADRVAIMVIAVIIAVIIMMASVRAVSEFVEKRPTVKMLALGFFTAYRNDACSRRLRRSYPQRLHLFCDGIFRICRNS